MTKEEVVKRYVPRLLFSLLRQMRHWYYRIRGFSHELAQKGELGFWKDYMDSGYDMHTLFVVSVSGKEGDYLPYSHSRMKYFFVDSEDYREFCKAMREKRCLEIGSGAVGDLSLMPWIKDRIVIDPLLQSFKQFQLDTFKKTLFASDITCYSKEAEIFIPELENTIAGFILCANTLDHCRDPWRVLKNIASYARQGSILLLWTDIWHKEGLNKEHKNITKDRGLIECTLEDLGFRIGRVLPATREDNSTIEYGCVVVKDR